MGKEPTETEKRAYEVRIKIRGIASLAQNQRMIEQMNAGVAQVFAQMFKRGEITAVRTVRKDEVRYTAIMDRVPDAHIKEARKGLRTYSTDKILLIDKGAPTAADYNLQKQGTIITVSADLIGDDEEGWNGFNT